MSRLLPIMPAATSGTVRLASPNPLFPGSPALFIQMPASGRAFKNTSRLLSREGMGAVITVSGENKAKALESSVGQFLTMNTSLDHVLFDADRYSGPDRRIGMAPLSRDWVRLQLEAGAPMAMTDSPYIGAGQQRPLRAILARTASFGDRVIAALPCHVSWLSVRANLDTLSAAINEYEVPVALMIEHRRDPFGVHAIQGLIDLLEQARVPVLLLRSDLSALGAVAFGASLGALGTSTSLRHIYIQTQQEKDDEEDKKFRPGAKVAAYVPAAMCYRSLDKIAAAVRADVNHPERWACSCDTCGSGPLSVITDETMAYQHSMACVSDLAEKLLGQSDPDQRRLAWVEKCRHAQTVNEEIRADLSIGWEHPKFLIGWHRLRQMRPTQ